jgi:hypothetical protein
LQNGFVCRWHSPWLSSRAQPCPSLRATLSGLITDENGGFKSQRRGQNLGTGAVRELKTNADGFYSTPNLIPGTYEVRVTAKGFQTLVQKEITLTVGAQQALNLSLKVGQLNQTVEVNAAPPDVQTTSSTISATVDSMTVRQLPSTAATGLHLHWSRVSSVSPTRPPPPSAPTRQSWPKPAE